MPCLSVIMQASIICHAKACMKSLLKNVLKVGTTVCWSLTLPPKTSSLVVHPPTLPLRIPERLQGAGWHCKRLFPANRAVCHKHFPDGKVKGNQKAYKRKNHYNVQKNKSHVSRNEVCIYRRVNPIARWKNPLGWKRNGRRVTPYSTVLRNMAWVG